MLDYNEKGYQGKTTDAWANKLKRLPQPRHFNQMVLFASIAVALEHFSVVLPALRLK
jgi:hypothetical protein